MPRGMDNRSLSRYIFSYFSYEYTVLETCAKKAVAEIVFVEHANDNGDDASGGSDGCDCGNDGG